MTNKPSRRAVMSLLAGASIAPFAPCFARAATYPDRPIHVIVPFSPGGAVDIVARTVMQPAGKELGETVVVENRAGASGNIAVNYVAKAAPDGYTVLIGANNLATNEALFGNLPFKAEKDLEPVVLVGYAPLMLLVPPSFPAKTVKDLVAMAKAAPDKLTYASAGSGTSGHLAAELFKQTTGIQALHVPYRGGAPALLDLMAGRVSFMFVDPVQSLSHVRANKLRAIAVGSPERLALLPDVPTVAESGYPGFAATVWWGFLVPAHTPGEAVARLNKDINDALATKTVQDALHGLGVTIKGGSPGDFQTFLKSETDKWTGIIRSAHISAG